VTPAEAARLLAEVGIPDPQRDAQRLYHWAAQQHGKTDDAPSVDAVRTFSEAIQKRLARVPVSRIIGRRSFWRHEFLISDAVLDPRPDTETLVELALGEPFDSVLDLGTGSGCILLSLLADRPSAAGLGTDVSSQALEIARKNAERLRVPTAHFQAADWLAGVEGQYDLIISNPPYIAASEMAALSPETLTDPDIALTPGGDGLDAYRAITRDALQHLTPGGRLLVEIGHTQGAPVTDLFETAGLADIAVHPDINGKDRVVSGRRP